MKVLLVSQDEKHNDLELKIELPSLPRAGDSIDVSCEDWSAYGVVSHVSHHLLGDDYVAALSMEQFHYCGTSGEENKS